VRAVPWADEAEQQLSTLALSACELSADVRIFGAGLKKSHKRNTKIPLKFEVARQVGNPSLCASVRAVTWADEVEQQLSVLALSGCELSADVRIFRAGLLEDPGTDHLSYVSSLRGQDKQAAPVSVPLCEQCHGQMRLSNRFPS